MANKTESLLPADGRKENRQRRRQMEQCPGRSKLPRATCPNRRNWQCPGSGRTNLEKRNRG